MLNGRGAGGGLIITMIPSGRAGRRREMEGVRSREAGRDSRGFEHVDACVDDGIGLLPLSPSLEL